MLKTPVIFLIFNRSEKTALVFEEIRKARPPKLFVVADGSRNEEERGLVEKTRAVIEKVDWPCEVFTDYSPENLGCRRRVWSGIDWAFNQLGENDGAIILEDDCLPDQSFFYFAEEMLKKYANNPQVMHVGGTCFQQDNHRFSPALSTELSTPPSTELSTGINLTKRQNSYYFSHISQIWGWATWKRAWKLYDGTLASWPKLKDTHALRSAFPTRLSYHYWAHMFDRMHADEMDTWDVAWTYTVFKDHGLCIMPTKNLVENIGGGASATHKASGFMNMKTEPLIFPLVHPEKIEVDEQADDYTYKKVFGINPTLKNTLSAFLKDQLPFLFKYIKRLVK